MKEEAIPLGYWNHGMLPPPPGHPHYSGPPVMNEEEQFRAQVRNETIDEMCDWLESCIKHVDINTEVYKTAAAMVSAMRGKKHPITDTLGTKVNEAGEVVTHYPVNHRP
jgi:hypothetical protein